MKTPRFLTAIVTSLALAALALAAARPAPRFPNSPYTLHDDTRPKPRIATPADSFSQNAKPPSDATLLFDGKDASKWLNNRNQPAAWRIDPEGYIESGRGLGGIHTRDAFADFQLHLEFATPEKPQGTSQERGNSGILFNGMYEVQILDNFNNPTYADGAVGALYGQTPPLVNASRPPGAWQTYDIIFESPRWNAAGELQKKAAATVLLNGILLHLRREFLAPTDGIGPTPYNSLGAYKPHAPEITIELQDHANPVRFRNIWLRPIGEYDSVK
jgi:hypothetical protein